MYPDSGMFLNYNVDDYSQAYGQIKEAFKALSKENILQLYIGEDVFRSSNDCDKICLHIHAFDIRYQKHFERGQSVKAEFIFNGVLPAGIFGYVSVLTNRLVGKSSDGQRMFHLVEI